VQNARGAYIVDEAEHLPAVPERGERVLHVVDADRRLTVVLRERSRNALLVRASEARLVGPLLDQQVPEHVAHLAVVPGDLVAARAGYGHRRGERLAEAGRRRVVWREHRPEAV